MHANERLIRRFYSSLERRDVRGIVACYDADVELTHPAIHQVRSWRAAAFWQMFCLSTRVLSIGLGGVRADDEVGEAQWEASYAKGSGRPQHQWMRAMFRFRGARIVRHDERIEATNGARTVGPHALLREERAAIAPLVHAGVQRALATFIVEKAMA